MSKETNPSQIWEDRKKSEMSRHERQHSWVGGGHDWARTFPKGLIVLFGFTS